VAIDYDDQKRIMLDLDGTICYTKTKYQDYEDVLPMPGAVDYLNKLKKEGWYIIISTARNMRTHKHNIGQVSAKQTQIIVTWLEAWDIPFDELWHKPHYYIAFDDKTKQYVSWEQVEKDVKDFTEKS
jgi:capsule biosynthesis phosphatase